ncbi:MAG: hypothetical protein HQ479_15585 [Rhodobacter sp.]|nr:hypothetical protein [Rhodobacter sp.]
MLASAAAAIILQGLARQQPMIPVGRVARAAWWLNGLAPKIYERLMVRNLTR